MQCPVQASVGDLLQIRQAEQFDVVLAESTVRDRRPDRVELQGFAGLIELQVEVGLIVEVGPGDQVEPFAFPGSDEILQRTQLSEDGLIVRADSVPLWLQQAG